MKKNLSMVCPNCEELLTSIGETQNVNVNYVMDFESQEWERKDDDSSADHVEYYCPSCGEAIGASDIPVKIKKLL